MHPGHRTWHAVVAAGVVALVAAGVWSSLRDEGTSAGGDAETSTPAGAVRAFFAARQRGDCDALATLITDPEDDFAETCSEVVGDYRPELRSVEVVSEDGDEAVVEIGIRPDRVPDGLSISAEPSGSPVDTRPFGQVAYRRGRLARTDDGWRVVLDDGFLTVGLSPEQTLWRFFREHRAGNCGVALASLSRDARPSGPARFAAASRCQAVAELRATDGERLLPTSIEPLAASGPDDEVTLTVRWPENPSLGTTPPDDTVTLVREGGRWRLTALPQVTTVIELAATLPQDDLAISSHLYPDWSRTVNLGSNYIPQLLPYGPAEDAARRRQAGFRGGVIRQYQLVPDAIDWLNQYGDPIVEHLVYEFADAEGAASYAEQLAGHATDQGTSTNPGTPIDGVTNGQLITCPRGERGDGDACEFPEAMAVGREHRHVVAVRLLYMNDDVTTPDLTTGTVTLLTDQIAALSGVTPSGP